MLETLIKTPEENDSGKVMLICSEDRAKLYMGFNTPIRIKSRLWIFNSLGEAEAYLLSSRSALPKTIGILIDEDPPRLEDKHFVDSPATIAIRKRWGSLPLGGQGTDIDFLGIEPQLFKDSIRQAYGDSCPPMEIFKYGNDGGGFVTACERLNNHLFPAEELLRDGEIPTFHALLQALQKSEPQESDVLAWKTKIPVAVVTGIMTGTLPPSLANAEALIQQYQHTAGLIDRLPAVVEKSAEGQSIASQFLGGADAATLPRELIRAVDKKNRGEALTVFLKRAGLTRITFPILRCKKHRHISDRNIDGLMAGFQFPENLAAAAREVLGGKRPSIPESMYLSSVNSLIEQTFKAQRDWSSFVQGLEKVWECEHRSDLASLINKRLKGRERLTKKDVGNYLRGEIPSTPFMLSLAQAWALDAHHTRMLWKIRSGRSEWRSPSRKHNLDFDGKMIEIMSTTPPDPQARSKAIGIMLEYSGYTTSYLAEVHGLKAFAWKSQNSRLTIDQAEKLLNLTRPLEDVPLDKRKNASVTNRRVLGVLTDRPLNKTLAELAQTPDEHFLHTLILRSGKSVKEMFETQGWRGKRTVRRIDCIQSGLDKKAASDLLRDMCISPENHKERELIIVALIGKREASPKFKKPLRPSVLELGSKKHRQDSSKSIFVLSA